MNDRVVARILTADPREHASWIGLADLAAAMPEGWSLAGGSLVRLHLAERGASGARATRDIDVILDVRSRPRSLRDVVEALRTTGFRPDGFNPAGHDHRWVRGDAQIDILTPDFLGPNLLDRRHPGLGRLLPTRGAQFGLDRSQLVTVGIDDSILTVRRPDLVGALYEKCSALLIPQDRDKSRHLADIAALALLITPSERRVLLSLRSHQRARVAQGIRRACIASDLDPATRARLGRLGDLIAP